MKRAVSYNRIAISAVFLTEQDESANATFSLIMETDQR